MRLVWPIIAVFGARFLATALTFPDLDGDLAWQRWLGASIRATARLPNAIGAETFSAAGAAWIPQEWLFAVVASMSSGWGWGWDVFAGAAAAAATGALILGSLRAARSAAQPLAIAAAAACAGISLFEAFGVRAQVFAWPLLALFLLLLEIDGPLAYGAIGIAILWSNVHASVMLAGPLALTFAAGSALDEGWSARTRRALLVGAGSLAATVANPLGFALPRYAIAVFAGPFKIVIAEWKHTDLGDAAFAFGALPLLLALTVFGVARWRDRGVVLLTTGLMFTALRNVPLFAIACFPIVARSLSAAIPARAAALQPARTAGAARLVPVASLLAALLLTYALVDRARSAAQPRESLGAALAAVGAVPGTHNVFCADFAWCSRLIGQPRERIFLDGRADPYPQAVWNDFATIVDVRPGWDAVLHARGANVILAARASALEGVLELSPDWRRVYGNDSYRVWTRSDDSALSRGLQEVGQKRLERTRQTESGRRQLQRNEMDVHRE